MKSRPWWILLEKLLLGRRNRTSRAETVGVLVVWLRSLRLLDRRRMLLAMLAFVAFSVCVGAFWLASRPAPKVIRPVSGEATVEFLDVGQGDAALITSPEGKTALIDAGPSNRVVRLLEERGVDRLDLVVVSHHHIDHYGGMAAVIRRFRPRVFLDSDSPHVTPSYLALLRLVKDEGITAIRAGPEERSVQLGTVDLTIFPQAPPDSKGENNNSVGVRVQFGGFSALFTGDAQVPERRWWSSHARALSEEVDVLKLAHHGSRNGTDSASGDAEIARSLVDSGREDRHSGLDPDPDRWRDLVRRDRESGGSNRVIGCDPLAFEVDRS
jgi:competence protein ComEC